MKIILYTDGGSDSKNLEARMIERDIPYEEVFAGSEKDSSKGTYPLLTVGDRTMGFNEAMVWVRQM